MKRFQREFVGIVFALMAFWFIVMMLELALLGLIDRPAGSGGFVLRPFPQHQYLPSNALGFVAALYVFRAYTRRKEP